MIQVLLCGTGPYRGQTLTAWIPDSHQVGESIKWNGSPWRISAQYGTRFAMGERVDSCERPDTSPLRLRNLEWL